MSYRLHFLFATLLTLPFALRKVFWKENATLFNEYSDTSLYLFEVFLLAYVLVSILEHKLYLKSIYKRVFHVEHILIGLLLCLSTLLAVYFEGRYYALPLLLKWIFYILFCSFFYKDLLLIVPRGTISKTRLNCSTWNNFLSNYFYQLFHVEHIGKLEERKVCSTWNILRFTLLISLFFQSLIILLQIVSQRSIGLFFLGEPILNASISGVATIIINKNEFLRGYGTFLHPNITAFFFFTYGIAYIILSIVPRGTFQSIDNGTNCSTWNNIWTKISIKIRKLFHVEQLVYEKRGVSVPRGTILMVYITVLVAFFFTFSKSVIAVTVITGFLWLFFTNCSTWNISSIKRCVKLFHVEHSGIKRNKYMTISVPRGTLIGLVIILVVFVAWSKGIPDFIQQSILERKLQYLSIPVDNPVELLVGQGLGSYVPALAEKSPGLYLWQLQPIHNTYVLLVFELGLLPLLGISVYLWQKHKKYRQYTQEYRYTFFRGFVIVVFFGILALLGVDHYMWDIEQGQFLGVLLITFLVFILRASMYDTYIPKNIK